jgi:eukaryotic-like serine/threonine-protein kinase
MKNYERRARIEALFEAALDLPEDDRGDWLESECAGDPELLAEVQALLAAHELADRIFAEPESAPLGGRVGPYRVIRELGRGGMGVVYLAERADGQFRRRVALKLVGTASEDDPVYQRFLAERQILAGLDHPNIARLLDGGVAEDGRPYLVLEYVEGLPITTYCERHRLEINERLRLFMAVCDAVQHAHQNLVLHRDLKPSNIMVTAAGQVRLLDFGIAKLLNPALSGVEAPVTQLELRAMTPDYASPEQVRGETLTTASDIYSLGILLYELLTGARPYRLETTSPAEIVAVVCEQDPEKPSARGRRELRGDLDSITMMALRKEPGRRYGSAALLGEDIDRYLDGLPVLAHRGSRRYRLGRLVRRHRTLAAAAVIVFVSLVGGLGTALWQAAVADRERARAEAAREEAEHALAQSEEVTNFLMALFGGGADGDGMGDQVTARDLLRRGAARADELADHPDVQARMLDVIGQMYRHLGRYDEAQHHLERAVAIRRDVLGPAAPDLAASLLNLAWVHRSRGNRNEALRIANEALSIRQATLPPDHPAIAEAIYQVGRATANPTGAEARYREALEMLQRTGADLERQVGLLQGLSTFARRRGDAQAAIASDRAALDLAMEVFGPEDHRTGYAMVHLADHVRDIEEDLVEAERLYRRGMELIARRNGENHTTLIHGLSSLAWLKTQVGEHEEAERLYRRTLAIRVAATGMDNPDAAGHLNALAGALERQGRLEEAEALARQAIETYGRALGPRHYASGATLTRLASILFAQGRVAESDSLYREAITTQIDRDDGPAPVAETRRSYARMLIQRGAWEAAETQLMESLRALEDWVGPDHPNTRETKRALAELYTAWGRPELAERYRVPPGRFVAY